MNVKPGDLITADLFNDIVDEIEELSDRIAKLLTAVKIDNGNVGIGTTKPLSKLDVYQGDLHVGAKFGDEDTSSRFIRVETMTPGEPSLVLSRGGNWAAKLLVTETSFRIRDFAGHEDGKDLVTILNTGKVGIGTASPSAKLHVQSDDDNAQVNIWSFGAARDAVLMFGTATSGENFYLTLDEDDGRKFKMGPRVADNKLVMQQNGNVGIGTKEPNTKLHIFGDNDATLKNDSGLLVVGKIDGPNIVMDNNEIMARNRGDTSTLHLQAEGGNLAVHSLLDGSRKVVITDSGNVGIGTSGPEARLDIANMGENLWLRLGDGGDGGRLWVEYGKQSAPLLVMSDFDDPPRIQFQQTWRDTEDDPEFASWIGHAKSQSSDIAIMGGNVGIGTPKPDHTLDVNGSVRGSQLRSSGSKGTDLVHIQPGDDENPENAAITVGNAGWSEWPFQVLKNGSVHYSVECTKKSSREIKENINTLSIREVFVALEKLNPVKFNLKADKEKKTYVGFIAEDVPDIAATSDRKAIISDHIVAILTKVVKEQQKAITLLTEKVKTWEMKNIGGVTP